MLPKIALISAKRSLNTAPILEKLKHKCELVVLLYERIDDVIPLYLGCKDDVAGFLFGGWLPYSAVAATERIEKPYAYFTISQSDLYRVMFTVSMENPEIDISRILLDNPTLGSSISRLPLNISKCRLTASNKKENVSAAILDEPSLSGRVGKLYSMAMESYIAAWKAGEIDVVVTRLKNLAPTLTRYGVKHYVLEPSCDSMIECAQGLINKV